jgi:hypothetical protein
MNSEDFMLRYAVNLLQRGDQVEMQRHCDELHRQAVILAELSVPVDVDLYRAEQSTKH